jgi:GNAT superfamily N-acetyltransferase
MADAKIVAVGPNEVGLIVSLYNRVFAPPQVEDFFMRRFQSRHNVNLLVAEIDKEPVGFIVGFEVEPGKFLCWLAGVLPEARRSGVATQLVQAQMAWAQDHEYDYIRFECLNQHRPMLHVALNEGYDLVGIRYDSDTGSNVVIFEKELV